MYSLGTGELLLLDDSVRDYRDYRVINIVFC